MKGGTMDGLCAVEFSPEAGGPVTRYDRSGHGLSASMAERFLAKVLVRAEYVHGRRFVGKVVPLANPVGS